MSEPTHAGGLFAVIPAVLLELDAALNILRANGAAERTLGAGLVGRSVFDRTGIGRALEPALRAVRDGGEPCTFWGYPLRLSARPDEDSFWDLSFQRLAPGADSALPEAVVLLFGVDVTSRIQAERGTQDAVASARRSTERLRSMLEQMTDGVVITTPEGAIETMNDAARSVLGDGRDAMESRVFELDGRRMPWAEQPWARAALGEIVKDKELVVQAPAHPPATMSISATPLRDEHDASAGAVALLRDVTVQYQRIAELREANARLEESSRLKNEFVANMSHELRTPLNAILGFTQLMRSGRAAEPLTSRQTDALDRVLRNARNLLTLIDGVLDVARIEAGIRVLHPEHFDLVEALQAFFGELESLATQKRLRYTMRVEGEFPPVFTDRTRLRQVIVNLLSNALKFTTEGSIELVVKRAGDAAHIDVIDTGIGIQPVHLDVIFDKFRQVDGSTTRSVGGIGLGLSISRELTELLGGELTVESTYGQGTTFHFVLPLDPSPDLSSIDTIGELSLSQPTDEPPAMPSDGRPLVLVVEDNPDSGVLLRESLERAGFRTRVADNGIAGLRLARTLLPAAITLDIMMPRMDGWRVLQALRQDARTAKIPVIVCSIVDNRLLGYRLGASDYLTKPFEEGALLTALARVGATAPRADEYILIVDDERGMRETVAAALEATGFAVKQAGSGEEALELVSQKRPRAMVLDMLMPGGMSGFEVLARLRSAVDTSDIPVVVLTGRDLTSEDRAKLGGDLARVVRVGNLELEDLSRRLSDALSSDGGSHA